MSGTCLLKYGSSPQPISHTNLACIIKKKTINHAISEELGRMVILRTITTLAGLSSGGKLEQGSTSDGGRAIVEGREMSS